MGLFDWLGPLNAGHKRRGWDRLPVIEKKASWTIDDYRAVIVQPLVHGPGATDLLASRYGADANSAVYACLNAIATSIAEPDLKVYRLADNERVEIPDAPILELFRRPNPYMTLDMLLAYVCHCLHLHGNAYWRKLRAGNGDAGNVVELWPISPTRLSVRTNKDSDDFISVYRYHQGPGRYEDIPPANIVHFRMGLKDDDHRLGDGPILRLAREVSSDERATRYADRLLGNFATPGLAVEFPGDAQPISQATADEIKAKIQAQYGGDNVGAVSVMSPGAKLTTHGFSPEQMDLKVLHRVPEERISAVLGVPAIVAGLGAGLDRATYANFREAREAFTETKLLPLWNQLAATIELSLLPDFTSDRNVLVAFDTDGVRALADDENAKAVRLDLLVKAGILEVDEARAELGRDPLPERPEPDNPEIVEIPMPAEMPALPASSTRSRLWTISRKAPDDLPGQFGRLKDQLEPTWQTEIETFLAGQLRRVTAALRAGQDTADGLLVEGEATLLGETLTPLQVSLLGEVTRLVVAELAISFQLDDAATREFLRQCGLSIIGITDTTREAVRAALLEGQMAGEGIPQLAARLRDLPAFNRARAITVSRTELGSSQNYAALASYRASRVVVGVRVWDGDYDAACAAMNGRTFLLDQAPPVLQHPRCLRAFSPITDAAEMERSA